MGLAIALATSGCGARTGLLEEDVLEADGGTTLCGPKPPPLAVAADSFAVDLVSIGDQPVPDGQRDAVFETQVAGPIAGVVLVTVGADGTACCGQQWDTLVRADPVPEQIGTRFATGAETWVLGVEVDGDWWTAPDGAIENIPEGCHRLRLVAADSGFFHLGQGFRAYFLRPDGELVAGDVGSYRTPTGE